MLDRRSVDKVGELLSRKEVWKKAHKRGVNQAVRAIAQEDRSSSKVDREPMLEHEYVNVGS